MPTECSADLFGFAPVEGREVVAAFDGGAITSDAGGLLLGATDHVIRMTARFAACFHDVRRQDLIEHEIVTLVGQRVFGIALGYEDLNDHDQLRHDPMMAVLAGKLEPRRAECALTFVASFTAWTLAELGEFAESETVGQMGFELAMKANHAYSISIASFGLAQGMIRQGRSHRCHPRPRAGLRTNQAAHYRSRSRSGGLPFDLRLFPR